MLRVPLKASFLVFQFDTIEDRDAVVDTLTRLVQQLQNAARPPASGHFSGPPALIAIKQKLLASDQ